METLWLVVCLTVVPAIALVIGAVNYVAFFTKRGRESGIWILTGITLVPGAAAVVIFAAAVCELARRIF